MSKGLGEIQRTILGTLSRIHQQRIERAAREPPYYARRFNSDDAAWVSINTLALHVFHADLHLYEDTDIQASRSEIVSVHRAVASLEKRGFVEVKIVKHRWSEFGGANRHKDVRLLDKR